MLKVAIQCKIVVLTYKGLLFLTYSNVVCVKDHPFCSKLACMCAIKQAKHHGLIQYNSLELYESHGCQKVKLLLKYRQITKFLELSKIQNTHTNYVCSFETLQFKIILESNMKLSSSILNIQTDVKTSSA